MKKYVLFIFIISYLSISSHDIQSIDVNTIEKSVTPAIKCTVTATMYYATEEQCDSDPTVTASGLIINPMNVSKKNYIAISRDMHKRYKGKFNFYDTVLIINAGHKSNKKYVIVDLMNKRWKNKIDFLESIGTKQYKYEDVILVKL